MNRNMFDDSRDDELADALRSALPQPPTNDVDWDGLHARITAAARPSMAAARPSTAASTPAWWLPLANWSPRGIPMAAAATVVLMLGAGALGTAGRDGSELTHTAISFRTVEEELVNGLSIGSRPLLAGMETDAMLDAVLFYDGEDW
jgi:hypothetical protein